MPATDIIDMLVIRVSRTCRYYEYDVFVGDKPGSGQHTGHNGPMDSRDRLVNTAVMPTLLESLTPQWS